MHLCAVHAVLYGGAVEVGLPLGVALCDGGGVFREPRGPVGGLMVSLRDSWALFGFARFVSMRTKLKVNSQKPTVQLVHRISNAMGEVMLFFCWYDR